MKIDKKYSLADIARKLVYFIGFYLCLCLGSLLVFTYNSLYELAERSETSISLSLLNSGLSFFLASGDDVAIEDLLSKQMANKEVFAIEIRDFETKMLYRKERDPSKSEQIIIRTYPIKGSGQNLQFGDFGASQEGNRESNVIGQLRISFSKSVLYGPIYRQMMIFFIISVLVLISILFTLRFFTNRFHKEISSLLLKVDAIKNESPLPPKTESDIHEIDVLDQSFIGLDNSVRSQKKALQDSLSKAVAAVEDAKQAQEFKDGLIKAIAHDVREPVHVVAALMSVLQKQLLKHSDNVGLNDRMLVCIESIEMLKSVVEDLFRFDQFSSSKLINTPKPVNIDSFFDVIGSTSEEMCRSKSLNFDIEIVNSSFYKKTEVSFDSNKLTRVIENLVTNAIKYTDKGSVGIYVKLNASQLVVSVKDTGIGISEDKTARIFERFVQLGEQVEAAREGRGLGLYYVKQLLDALEGDISVDSKVGFGSVFTVKIPVSLREESPSIVIKKNDANISAIIIDDNKGARLALKAMLDELGIACDVISDAIVGFNQLEQGNYDVAFIDYHMPVLNGLDLAKKLKLNHSKTTFMVCTTADASSESNPEFDDFFHQVLKKPFSMEALSFIVEAVPSAQNTNIIFK